MGSISHHITPLVIYSLRGRHTHTQTHEDIRTDTILKNKARAWYKTKGENLLGAHALDLLLPS